MSAHEAQRVCTLLEKAGLHKLRKQGEKARHNANLGYNDRESRQTTYRFSTHPRWNERVEIRLHKLPLLARKCRTCVPFSYWAESFNQIAGSYKGEKYALLS
ncbi:hypothetical protein EDF61_109122 [Arthrobacter sp. JUb115]|nr:hypothetical protein EDF61_109122 [Arthrobacter sp. JUb115]